VTAHVGVRFDELEELVREFESMASTKDIFSLGAELGNIGEGRQKRWTVANAADVKAVARSIMDGFSKIGLPYLEKYSEMQTALEALSGDDQSAWLHQPFHDARSMRALGLAFLLGDAEKFHGLADAKTAFLAARYAIGLQPFLRFRDALERRLAALAKRK
jgi:hypothetical protein